MYFAQRYASPLGEMVMAGDGDTLSGLWFYEQKYYLGTLPEEPVEKAGISVFQKTCEWLDCYFSRQNPDAIELALAPIGGEFRQEVWKILLAIPYGQVTTYGAIAKEIAAKKGIERMSAQAVGGAVGHNPVSIIIPCHRVIGTDGSLTGYASGLDVKIKLLELEGHDISAMWNREANSDQRFSNKVINPLEF